jgi:hypothetical protein
VSISAVPPPVPDAVPVALRAVARVRVADDTGTVEALVTYVEGSCHRVSGRPARDVAEAARAHNERELRRWWRWATGPDGQRYGLGEGGA